MIPDDINAVLDFAERTSGVELHAWQRAALTRAVTQFSDREIARQLNGTSIVRGGGRRTGKTEAIRRLQGQYARGNSISAVIMDEHYQGAPNAALDKLHAAQVRDRMASSLSIQPRTPVRGGGFVVAEKRQLRV